MSSGANELASGPLDGTVGSVDEAPSSVAVVDAVAAAAGRSPDELPPLTEVLDPDALDGLFTGQGEGRISFWYAGHAVTVAADGRITVD